MSFRGGQIQQLHPTTNHNIHINVTNAVGTRKNSLQCSLCTNRPPIPLKFKHTQATMMTTIIIMNYKKCNSIEL